MLKLAALLAAALIVAGCGTTKTVTKTVTVPEVGPPNQLVQFGHIASLKAKGNGFVMRFDPEWFLSGVTANTAAAEDGAVEPGEPVPNDNYRLEEGHRLLTFLVPANAHVTVLTRHGTGQFGATPITVDELARIVGGGKHRKLFEPLETGVWIRYHIDTVRSIDQQYQP
jgi:hypothetical protein